MTEATRTPALESPVGADAVWQSSTKICRIPHFLGEDKAAAILERAIAAGRDEVVRSRVRDGLLDTNVRRSRMHHGFAAPELESALKTVLKPVGQALGVACGDTEPAYSLVAHNDGDFYRPHQDVKPAGGGAGPAAGGAGGQDGEPVRPGARVVTFVYYVHRTPKPFTGGNLRVFDSAVPLHLEGDLEARDCSHRDVPPEHDSVVFFLPTALHEVRPTACPSGEHADSRFAINGWMCRR